MKFSNTLLSVLALLVTPVVLAAQISYDPMYDIKIQSLASVACSDGSNGMLTKGYLTFGDLPTFPYIGGGKTVAGYNSPNCGTCWKVTYQNSTITMVVIDTATISDVNLSLEAMNKLTNNQAVHDGIVQGTIVQVANSACGL